MSIAYQLRTIKRLKSLKFTGYWRKIPAVILVLFGFGYTAFGLYLYLYQRQIIISPRNQIRLLPSDPDFDLSYQEVWIPVDDSQDRIHGWWLPAPTPSELPVSLPSEPSNILTSEKTILYFCGRGSNKSYYNYLVKIKSLQQLGFSVLIVDYRGFGSSKGDLPSEASLYADSRAAWKYLTQTKNIAAEDIIIYGQSLGGAVAVNLASEQPNAAGLIVQGSFTSMSEQVRASTWLEMFPLWLILNQRFDSISKVRSLEIPVLFIHGSKDQIVPPYMSQQLYHAAPEPKQLHLVPRGNHFQIYQPGEHSYLQAIGQLVNTIESQAN